MKISRNRLAVALAAGVLAAGLSVASAGAASAPTTLASASTSTAPAPAATPPVLTTTQLATATMPPTLLFGHGKTGAGAPWGALLVTTGTTDAYVVDNKFDPGATTGWHSHPGPSLILVVAGSITNYDSSDPQCTGKTYPAGTTFTDAGGRDVHMLRDDGTAPAETIAVQFIPQQQPRKIAEPEPANCHVAGS